MKIVIGLLLCFACMVLLTGLIWRLFSRRQSLPCPVWLRWMVELDNPFTRVNRAATILDLLDLSPGMRVLDVGCGPGRLTLPAAARVGGTVTAMDIQEGMLRRVAEKAEAAGMRNIELLCAGIGEGRLARDHYDRALLVTVLGEIPDRAAALRELFSALKPGGILSVTEIIFDPHFQGRRGVETLAGQAGFHVKAFHGNRIAYTLHLEKSSSNRSRGA